MRIVHLSFAFVKGITPEAWLAKISFFTGILECQAEDHDIVSVHCIESRKTFLKNGVEYHFFKPRSVEKYWPLRLTKFVKRLNPAVVIVHGLVFPWHVILLRLQLPRDVKIYIQHHAEQPQRSIKAMLQKLADRFVTGYFFSANGLAAPWIKRGQITSLKKIHQVMEVSSSFRPMFSLATSERGSAKLNYLWIGRLDSNKDPITLINAFNKYAHLHPDVSLNVIFQTDELLAGVKKLVNESSSIALIGKVDHEALTKWFLNADFIISTSHSEGSGVAVCEGMSLGCIPIVTQIPSFEMMVQKDCGLFFQAGDANSLLDALNRSRELNRDEFSKAVIRQFDESLSFSAISKKMNDVIMKDNPAIG